MPSCAGCAVQEHTLQFAPTPTTLPTTGPQRKSSPTTCLCNPLVKKLAAHRRTHTKHRKHTRAFGRRTGGQAMRHVGSGWLRAHTRPRDTRTRQAQADTHTHITSYSTHTHFGRTRLGTHTRTLHERGKARRYASQASSKDMNLRDCAPTPEGGEASPHMKMLEDASSALALDQVVSIHSTHMHSTPTQTPLTPSRVRHITGLGGRQRMCLPSLSRAPAATTPSTHQQHPPYLPAHTMQDRIALSSDP